MIPEAAAPPPPDDMPPSVEELRASTAELEADAETRERIGHALELVRSAQSLGPELGLKVLTAVLEGVTAAAASSAGPVAAALAAAAAKGIERLGSEAVARIQSQGP